MDRSFFRFATIHAFDRRTDGQTDRILIARPCLHSMQRGKNSKLSGEGYLSRTHLSAPVPNL